MAPIPVQLHAAVSPEPSSPPALPLRRAGAPSLARVLDELDPVTLAELDAVALLNRFDTKFLLTESQLIEVLPALAEDYLVLDIQGRRLHQYRTLYFDTPRFDLYRQHHAGRPMRHKVRSRTYVDTGLSFVEIKSKTSTRRTIKHRLATSSFLTELSPEASAFVTAHLAADVSPLRPTIRNDFVRVTLVGKRCAERLTIDVGIHFDCEGRTAILPGIAIAELKRSDPDRDSPFLHAMRSAQVEPTSFSKYCVGIGLLVADVERDAFEETL